MSKYLNSWQQALSQVQNWKPTQVDSFNPNQPQMLKEADTMGIKKDGHFEKVKKVKDQIYKQKEKIDKFDLGDPKQKTPHALATADLKSMNLKLRDMQSAENEPTVDDKGVPNKKKEIKEEESLNEVNRKLPNLVGQSIAHLDMYVELAQDVKKTAQISMSVKAKAEQVLKSVPKLVKELKAPRLFDEEVFNEACWDGYKKVGMKNKGGKQVPNCVPDKGNNIPKEKPQEESNEACWDGYKKVGMKKKGDRIVPNCVPEVKEHGDGMQPADVKRLNQLGPKDDKIYVHKDGKTIMIPKRQHNMYLAKGWKQSKLKAEGMEEAYFSKDQLDRLAKSYSVMKNKTISPANAQKLGKMIDGIPDSALNDLRKKKIPFISGLALSKMLKKKIPVTEAPFAVSYSGTKTSERKGKDGSAIITQKKGTIKVDSKDEVSAKKLVSKILNKRMNLRRFDIDQVRAEDFKSFREDRQPGFAVRFLDPANKKRFAVAFKTKKDADDKAAQLKRDGLKDITITKHTLNFKEDAQQGKTIPSRPLKLKEVDDDYLKSRISPQQIANIKKLWQNKKASDVTPAIRKMIKDYDIPTQIAIKQANINHLSKLVEVNKLTLDKVFKEIAPPGWEGTVKKDNYKEETETNAQMISGVENEGRKETNK